MTFALLASLVCALTVVPVLAYFLIDKVKLDVDEDGEPEQLDLGPRLHPDHHVRPAQPLDQARRRRGRRRPVLRLARARAAAADPVHQRRLREDPRRSRVAPPTGASSEAVLEQADRGRDDPPRRPGRRARPDEHPGRGRHQLPDVPVAAQSGRPANSATMTVRLEDDADLDGRPRRGSPTRSSRSRPTATTSRSSEAAGFTSNGLNVIVSGRDPADGRARRPTAVLAGARGQRRPAQPQERPRQGHARGPGHGRPEQGDHRRADRRPGRRTRSAPRSSRRRRPRSPSTDGQPIDARRPGRPGGGRPRSSDSRRCRSGPSRRCRSATIATVEQVDVQGSITRIDERPGRVDHGRDHRATTPAPSRSRVQAEIDALDGRRARSRPASTVELAGVSQQQSEAFGGLFASMGVADPARLRDDGPDLQLAHHPVHHPVHACRWRRSAPSRRCTSPAGRSASAPSSGS